MVLAAIVSVEVEPGAATEDGVSLRFKAAGPPRAVTRVRYEAEDGTVGLWHVAATDDATGAVTRPATVVDVEDSSAGMAQLIVGGAHGLVLRHEASGACVREAYLLLSLDAPAE